MNLLGEGFYPSSELYRELLHSVPSRKNTGEFHDLLLKFEDILRVLDGRLDIYKQAGRIADMVALHTPLQSLRAQEIHLSNLSDLELEHHPMSSRRRSEPT